MEKLTWIPYAPTVGNIDIDVEAERRRVSGVSLFLVYHSFLPCCLTWGINHTNEKIKTNIFRLIVICTKSMGKWSCASTYMLWRRDVAPVLPCPNPA